MLTEKSAATIRATLPVVGESLGEIAPLFYDKLFTAHPELLRDLFNRGNQANGEQQKALAGAIVAYATALLDQPDVRPDTMLQRVAHKHASLGVTRDQYPIVRTHLFAAIAEVLGDAATEETVAAWDEVYWLMANALAAIEDRLYAEAAARDGDTWRDYRVVGRQAETDDVTTFVVGTANGSPLASSRPGQYVARPGQYVSVQVELADGARQIRQYSLTGTGDDTLRFAVKRVTGPGTPDGEVSNHLHARVREGDLVRLSAPFGDVFLEDGDRPVLLASAGIGCTPMIGMLGHLASTGSSRTVIAVHADRSPRTHALRTDLDQLVAKLPDATAHVWYEEPDDHGWPAERTGRADLSTVPVPEGTVAYLCGPLPFLRAVRTQLLERGVRPADVHYEVFGPDLWHGGER